MDRTRRRLLRLTASALPLALAGCGEPGDEDGGGGEGGDGSTEEGGGGEGGGEEGGGEGGDEEDGGAYDVNDARRDLGAGRD